MSETTNPEEYTVKLASTALQESCGSERSGLFVVPTELLL